MSRIPEKATTENTIKNFDILSLFIVYQITIRAGRERRILEAKSSPANFSHSSFSVMMQLADNDTTTKRSQEMHRTHMQQQSKKPKRMQQEGQDADKQKLRHKVWQGDGHDAKDKTSTTWRGENSPERDNFVVTFYYSMSWANLAAAVDRLWRSGDDWVCKWHNRPLYTTVFFVGKTGTRE